MHSYHKDTDLLPYSASINAEFKSITGNDPIDALVNSYDLVHTVYAGLVEKYGMPTSAMVDFNNYSNGEREIKELSSEFYSDKIIRLLDIAKSWNCPEDEVIFHLQFAFSNVEYSVTYAGKTVECKVIFFSEQVKPKEVIYQAPKEKPPVPVYEDSGF